MAYSPVILDRAIDDIQKGIDYYDSIQVGLGDKFNKQISKFIDSLETNPHFRIRYDDIRCLPVKKYPYMLHYSIDEVTKTVFIHAVINTYLNPENHWVK